MESPAFEVVTAAERFPTPTRKVNELWQTDFTYFKILNWGWYYLSTVLDDYSRYILAWKLTPTMLATDVQETLELALANRSTTQSTAYADWSSFQPAYFLMDARDWAEILSRIGCSAIIARTRRLDIFSSSIVRSHILDSERANKIGEAVLNYS